RAGEWRGGARRGGRLRTAQQAHRLEPSLVPIHEREVLIAEQPMERLGEGHAVELDAHLVRVADLAPDLRSGLPAELVEDIGHRRAREVHRERVPLVVYDPPARIL